MASTHHNCQFVADNFKNTSCIETCMLSIACSVHLGRLLSEDGSGPLNIRGKDHHLQTWFSQPNMLLSLDLCLRQNFWMLFSSISLRWSLLYNNIADHKAKPQAASVNTVFTIAQIDDPNILTLFSYLYSLFHIPTKVLKAFLQNFIELTKDDVTYLNNLTQTCTICQWTNPDSNIRPLLSPPTKFVDIFMHKTGR